MRYLLMLLIIFFQHIAISSPLKIATNTNLKLLNVNYQNLLEVAITNAGYQVKFIEFENKNTLNQTNTGELDGELYRYSHTMDRYKNLLKIPVELNSDALFVYVAQHSDCPDFYRLTDYTPIGIIDISYFDTIYDSSHVGFIELPTVTLAIETLVRQPLSFTVFPEDITLSLMKLTGVKLKKCYQNPIYVLTAYSYLHQKHADKIDAISRELNTLLLNQ